MGTEGRLMMRPGESVIEGGGNVEEVHHLRHMALLDELVREKGHRGVAEAWASTTGQWPRA